MSVVYCQVEVSVSADHSSRVILPRGVCQCDRESSIMRRPIPLGALPFICTDKNI